MKLYRTLQNPQLDIYGYPDVFFTCTDITSPWTRFDVYDSLYPEHLPPYSFVGGDGLGVHYRPGCYAEIYENMLALEYLWGATEQEYEW